MVSELNGLSGLIASVMVLLLDQEGSKQGQGHVRVQQMGAGTVTEWWKRSGAVLEIVAMTEMGQLMSLAFRLVSAILF